MDEREPGLLPILPNFQRQPGPSPLIPIIVLVIVGTLRWILLEMLRVWDTVQYEAGVYDWNGYSTDWGLPRPQLTTTTLLIPIGLLLLVVLAFGIPQGDRNRNGAAPPSPFVQAITQNIWSSIFLVVVVVILLTSIPIRSVVQSPWQSPWRPEVVQPYQPYGPAYRAPPRIERGHVGNGICQELGILKRRCENWKGTSRDAVCRDLAILQKKCERSNFNFW